MIRDVRIPCDGLQLAASLHLPPAGDRPPLVVGCHGLLADRNSPKQVSLARTLSAAGIAYLRLDHRGCGDSQGDFAAHTTLAARCRDLTAAVAWMRENVSADGRLGLFGSSMGGAVCLASARELRPAAVVTAAAPVRSRLAGRSREAGPPPTAEQAFFDPPERRFDIAGRLAGVRHVLLFHGDADEVVPIDHAREILACLAPPKKLRVLEGGDHRMSRPAHQALFLREAAAWLRDRLAPPA